MPPRSAEHVVEFNLRRVDDDVADAGSMANDVESKSTAANTAMIDAALVFEPDSKYLNIEFTSRKESGGIY